MIVKIFLSWIIKIVTGSILSLIALIVINDMPKFPLETVVLRLMLIGSVVFLPVLVALLVVAGTNSYSGTKELIRKLVRVYLVVFGITFGLGNILIIMFFQSNHLVLPVLNFSVSVFFFGLGALLAWMLVLRYWYKSLPEISPTNPEVIDDL